MNDSEEIRVDSPPVADPLTDRQRQVLEFIRRTITERGTPPTVREIGLHVGLKSTNAVNDHLRALERKGFLKREEARPHGHESGSLPRGALTEEQNERVRKVLRELVDVRFGGQTSHLALEIDVDQSTLSGFLSRRQGTSFRVAERVAALAGRSVTEILTGEAPSKSKTLAVEDEYPSRARVLAMAEAKGVDKAAIAGLRVERLKGPDPGDDFWTKRLVELITQSKRLDAELQRAETPEEQATFGEPKDEEPER